MSPAAPRTLQHPRPNPVLPQSRSGSARCAPEHRQALCPGVPPGGGLLGAEAPAVGGEEAALPAEAELPVHVKQVCGSRRAPVLGGALGRESPLDAVLMLSKKHSF